MVQSSYCALRTKVTTASAMLGLIGLAPDHDVNAISCTRRDSYSISRRRETMESFCHQDGPRLQKLVE